MDLGAANQRINTGAMVPIGIGFQFSKSTHRSLF